MRIFPKTEYVLVSPITQKDGMTKFIFEKLEYGWLGRYLGKKTVTYYAIKYIGAWMSDSRGWPVDVDFYFNINFSPIIRFYNESGEEIPGVFAERLTKAYAKEYTALRILKKKKEAKKQIKLASL